MRFKNKGKAVQVRLDANGGYRFELVWPGEIIDLPERVGLAHGFEKVGGDRKSPTVTKGKIGEKTVETKQFDSGDFYNELIRIKGLGYKTAEDIIEIFTKKGLIKAIKNKEKLPFRDDVEKKLRRKYGKK